MPTNDTGKRARKGCKSASRMPHRRWFAQIPPCTTLRLSSVHGVPGPLGPEVWPIGLHRATKRGGGSHCKRIHMTPNTHQCKHTTVLRNRTTSHNPEPAPQLHHATQASHNGLHACGSPPCGGMQPHWVGWCPSPVMTRIGYPPPPSTCQWIPHANAPPPLSKEETCPPPPPGDFFTKSHTNCLFLPIS